jgi:hypothetical protein
MKTQESQNQQEKNSQNNSDGTKKNQIKNQTPAEKNQEEKLTEKDLNPSKEEKKIVHEHGKGEQQTGNKTDDPSIKPQSTNTNNLQKL